MCPHSPQHVGYRGDQKEETLRMQISQRLNMAFDSTEIS